MVFIHSCIFPFIRPFFHPDLFFISIHQFTLCINLSIYPFISLLIHPLKSGPNQFLFPYYLFTSLEDKIFLIKVNPHNSKFWKQAFVLFMSPKQNVKEISQGVMRYDWYISTFPFLSIRISIILSRSVTQLFYSSSPFSSFLFSRYSFGCSLSTPSPLSRLMMVILLNIFSHCNLDKPTDIFGRSDR